MDRTGESETVVIRRYMMGKDLVFLNNRDRFLGGTGARGAGVIPLGRDLAGNLPLLPSAAKAAKNEKLLNGSGEVIALTFRSCILL